jgi:ketosteroid isomerase-like protein
MAEDVEIVRQGYEALARGDAAALLALLDDVVAADERERSPYGINAYHGHEGVLRLFAAVNDGFEDVVYALEAVEQAGDGVVIAEVRRTGRGTASGIHVDERQFHVLDLVDARIVRFRSFVDGDAARAAAGAA